MPGKFNVIDSLIQGAFDGQKMLDNLKIGLAAVGIIPDNTGYEILLYTGYLIILDNVLYWIQDNGFNQIPDS